jgi:hypothetical protein
VPESLSTSILWQISQLIGFILVIIMDLFRDQNGIPKNNMYNALIFQAAAAGVCLLFALVFNGPMSRTEALIEQEEMWKADALGINSHNTLNIIASNPSHRFFDSSDTLQTLGEEEVEIKQHHCHDHNSDQIA